MESNVFKVEVAESGHSYLVDGVLKPHLFMSVGQTYVFQVDAKGHPFYITESPIGEEGEISEAVEEGQFVFKCEKQHVGLDLYYQCSRHPKMGYKIFVLA